MTDAASNPSASSALRVRDLRKVYRLYATPTARVLEAVHPFRKKYHREFAALDGVSFEIPRGETVAFIGKNGSGKSTLLKLITGIQTPTSGDVDVRGRISALLELGTGFNPEMTGIENVFLSGTILGLPRATMEARLDDILAFADIGDYVHQPVKQFSSGMFVRLAFAVAAHVDPEVLIVDEALSVGDMRFQQKCYRRIRDFKAKGVTILFVSHDMGSVVNFCDRCLWLKDGRVEQDGAPVDVVRAYSAFMSYEAPTAAAYEPKTPEKTRGEELWHEVAGCSSFGDRGAEITRVALSLACDGTSMELLQGHEEVVFAMEVIFHHDVLDPVYGVLVKDQYGNQIISFNSFVYSFQSRARRAGERVEFRFTFRFPLLRNGEYSVSAAVADGTQDVHIMHHWVHDALLVQVAKDDSLHKLGGLVIMEEVCLSES